MNLNFSNFGDKRKGGTDPKKNEKKAKLEQEKQSINKQYEDISVDDLSSKYKTQIEVNLFP